jgi:hypothetical protein
MTLSSVFLVAPGTTLRHHTGRTHSPNASSLATVPYPDSEPVGGVGAQGKYLFHTGFTTDRPVAAAGRLEPPFGMVFYDTTLAKFVFFVGRAWSSTQYIDQTGAVS